VFTGQETVEGKVVVDHNMVKEMPVSEIFSAEFVRLSSLAYEPGEEERLYLAAEAVRDNHVETLHADRDFLLRSVVSGVRSDLEDALSYSYA
jgi:hypothetical protein